MVQLSLQLSICFFFNPTKLFYLHTVLPGLNTTLPSTMPCYYDNDDDTEDGLSDFERSESKKHVTFNDTTGPSLSSSDIPHVIHHKHWFSHGLDETMIDPAHIMPALGSGRVSVRLRLIYITSPFSINSVVFERNDMKNNDILIFRCHHVERNPAKRAKDFQKKCIGWQR